MWYAFSFSFFWKKICSWGQRAVRATDLSQMCIFETTGKAFASTFGRNFLLSCGHYRASSSGKRSHRVHNLACVGVPARISTHAQSAHNLVHRCTKTPVQTIHFFFILKTETKVAERIHAVKVHKTDTECKITTCPTSK